MGLGPYIYMAWFAVVLGALVMTVIHVARGGFRGVGPALLAITGALLSWAFVSAYIGAVEVDGYVTSGPFAVSLTIGMTGIGLMGWSGLKFKTAADKTRAARRSPRTIRGAGSRVPGSNQQPAVRP